MSNSGSIKSISSKHLNSREIVFTSDLHFDFTERKFKAKAAPQRKDAFIEFIKRWYPDCILCLAGDFFNSHKKTLAFVKELEQNQITGFFVLGNHDFWNNGTKGYNDIIELFDNETKENKYFKFLSTGRKYYLGDLCLIGDTGWTSFKRKKRRVTLKQFMDLPDARKVKGFSPKRIMAMHEEWVQFANEVMRQEEKVLVLTHFPMIDFTQEDKDCWWSSTTELSGENSWRIFGHTHKQTSRCKEQRYNNVSSQRGYDNRYNESLAHLGLGYYSFSVFGKLEKTIDSTSLVTNSRQKIISKHFTSQLVKNASGEFALITKIKRRGFRRCAANKFNFAVLANEPEMYLERVKHVMDGYLKDTYIGYKLADSMTKELMESIFSSIDVLENGDRADIRAFMTAAVITGYVYNGVPHLLQGMRPLDDYDIIRFWMMFLTMQQYGIDQYSVYSVRKSSNNYIEYGNVEIYLPAVNEIALSVYEVEKIMDQTPMLPNSTHLLEE